MKQSEKSLEVELRRQLRLHDENSAELEETHLDAEWRRLEKRLADTEYKKENSPAVCWGVAWNKASLVGGSALVMLSLLLTLGLPEVNRQNTEPSPAPPALLTKETSQEALLVDEWIDYYSWGDDYEAEQDTAWAMSFSFSDLAME